MRELTLPEWLGLSDLERARWLSALNAYGGEGAELIGAIGDRFREEYGHLEGLEVLGPGVFHGGTWVIGATHPFVFDRRRLPHQYLGIDIRASVRHPLPPEFDEQRFPDAYVWAPPNFEKFVDRCFHEIREALRDPDMTRAEMLHALIGMPFEEHLAHCRRSVREGRIPPFE
jgi:hypothetical protein